VVAITAGMPYEQLYTEHGPAARRLALSLVPEHAAEDVVSEAFTKVMAATRRHGSPAAFGPYLLAAVRNTALSYHARGRRLVPVPDPEPAPAASAESLASDREDARLAGVAFRALPPRWQQVLWATAVEEVSAHELADRWGMAPNAVSQLASRAREGLRQQYLTANLAASVPPACRKVAPYMGAAVRGRASRRHERQLSAHLGRCGRCGQAFAGLGALNHNLGGLLVPAAAAVSWGLTRTAAKAAGRGWHLHPLAWLGLTATAAGAAIPFGMVHPGDPAPPQVRASVPGSAAADTGAGYVPRHARAHAGITASARPAAAIPAAGLGITSAVPAAGGTVHQVTTTAGTAVSQLGGLVGTTVAGTGWAAGQLVSGATSGAGPAVAGLGSTAGGAVSDAAGTAGQLAQNVTGVVSGVLGGL
jgi:RNA polymerase sigma factor (sigma-70 family)